MLYGFGNHLSLELLDFYDIMQHDDRFLSLLLFLFTIHELYLILSVVLTIDKLVDLKLPFYLRIYFISTPLVINDFAEFCTQ